MRSGLQSGRPSTERIVVALAQADAGMPVAELIRHVSISEQAFHRRKKGRAGLQMDQVPQLKRLQIEVNVRSRGAPGPPFGDVVTLGVPVSQSPRPADGVRRRRESAATARSSAAGEPFSARIGLFEMRS